MEKSPWMALLVEDMARQMEELSGQLGEAVQTCLGENGPLAYESILMNGRSEIEVIGKAVATGSFEALYSSFQNMNFGRLASIRSKDTDGDKKAFVSACRDRVKKAVAKCKELYGRQSPEEVVESMRGARTVIRELLGLIGMFDQAYRDAKRERDVSDFSDLEHLTLEVLYEREETGDGEGMISRRPFQVADELSRWCKEILVDEYQDSNYAQEALITSIFRERSDRPNVFMAGDVKQSIYRFRLTRPELFMDKYETYSREGGPRQMIELQQSFRSRKPVLTSVNDVFYQIVTKNLGGVTYTFETVLCSGAKSGEVSGKVALGSEADAGRPGSRGTTPVSLKAGTPAELLLVDAGVDILRQLGEDSLDYTAKELEARLITGGVRRLVSEDQGVLVWSKSRGGYRRARYGGMVILLRSMSGWSRVFVDVLMNKGIPVFAQTKTGYFNTVEVETILSLLSVVDNPMQGISLAVVMRSPIMGMDDEGTAWMMTVYKRGSKKGQDRGIYGARELWLEEGWTTVGLSDIPVETVHSISFKSQRLSVLMERLRREARHLSIRELLHRVYRESGYYDYVSAVPAGETRRANLGMPVGEAAAYKFTSHKGLFHFARYIEKLKKFNAGFGETSVAGERDGTVCTMSVHESKGLEFPVVFLASLGKRSNKQDACDQTFLDVGLGAMVDFLDLGLWIKASALRKQTLGRRTGLETMGEELRVLYVVMTRAREKLVMTAADKSLKNKLGKRKDIPLSQGQLPCTILVSANSCLD